MQTQTKILPEYLENEALIDHQRMLEEKFSKNQLMPRLRREFVECDTIDFSAIAQANEIPVPFAIDVLVHMALRKRADLPTLVGILHHHFGDSQATADMLKTCAEADLVDWNSQLRQFIVKFTISADLQEELDRYQYPLPMVIPPKHLRRNTDTGYLMGKGSVILKNNHHDNDVCLDHLNRVNRIKFSIDEDTATMVTNQWRNLDKPKPGETKQDFEKRRKAFEKYDRTSRAVIGELTRYGNEFYLTHRYDKRGRTYCMGYHVDYQGATWNKAVIQLADKELVQ